MNALVEATQTVLFPPARLLAGVEYSYSYSSHGQAPGPVFWICWLAFTILMIAAFWKIFSKAGQPGWAAIVPIYNWIVWCKIVGRPAWWVLLLLICFPIFYIILAIDLAKSFGKGVGFAIGMLLLPFIFFLILGFDSAQYQGPAAAGPVAPGSTPSAP